MTALPLKRTSVPRWVPVFGAGCLNFALGSVYAWSVFVLPLEREFGWTRSETSWVFTILMLMTTICVVIGGKVQDRWGPRGTAITGALALGFAYILASRTTTLRSLYVEFGLLAGIGNGVGYSATVPVASKWFPDKRGLAVGLLVGAYGAGSALIGPLAAFLIDRFGWRWTFQALGIGFAVLGMAGGFLIRNPPVVGTGHPQQAAPQHHDNSLDVRTASLLRMPTFYILWLSYLCGTTAGMMTISQLVPFARSSGLSETAATLAVTVGAFANTSGRIASGWLSDWLGRLTTLRMIVAILTFAMPVLFMVRHNMLALYVFIAIVYWCYGTQLSVFAATCADFFGVRHLGMNYGVLFTAVGVAGVLGPILGAQAFERFGDYRYAFYVSGIMAAISLLTLGAASKPTRPARESVSSEMTAT